MKALREFFSDRDLAAIEEAVRGAEGRTSGEIVPYAVEQSDGYASATRSAALVLGGGASLAAAAVHAWIGIWGIPSTFWIAAPPLLGGAIGWLAAATVPAIRRWFVPRALLEERTWERAVQAFHAEEVFATRERTGILIFVSLFERRVIVLADRGIAAKVAATEWEGVVAEAVRGIRDREPGTALARAIRSCGEILERHGVLRSGDDRDELRDGMRWGSP